MTLVRLRTSLAYTIVHYRTLPLTVLSYLVVPVLHVWAIYSGETLTFEHYLFVVVVSSNQRAVRTHLAATDYANLRSVFGF